MVKIMAGILGLALTANPLFTFAKDANSNESAVGQQLRSQPIVSAQRDTTKPPAARQHPHEKRYGSFCKNKSDGQMSGVVIGIGGNWFGDALVPFTIQDPSGTITTEMLAYKFTTDESKLMFDLLLASFTTLDTISVKCLYGMVGAAWSGKGP